MEIKLSKKKAVRIIRAIDAMERFLSWVVLACLFTGLYWLCKVWSWS